LQALGKRLFEEESEESRIIVILVVIVSDGEKWEQRLKLRLRNNFYVQINHPFLSLAPDLGGTFFGSHAKSAHN
jgi:hypothetical protein